MPREIETKFKIESRARFIKELRRIGAGFISKRFERDTYYRSFSAVSRAGSIRLRAINKKQGIFTVKFPVESKLSRIYKIRSETEIDIGDVEAFNVILKALGFIPFFKKEKKRELYTYGKVKITLDRLPFIGRYAEIEGPKKRIKETAELLGLDMAKAIPDTYTQLFNYYKILHKKPKLKFTFREEKFNDKIL